MLLMELLFTLLIKTFHQNKCGHRIEKILYAGLLRFSLIRSTQQDRLVVLHCRKGQCTFPTNKRMSCILECERPRSTGEWEHFPVRGNQDYLPSQIIHLLCLSTRSLCLLVLTPLQWLCQSVTIDEYELKKGATVAQFEHSNHKEWTVPSSVTSLFPNICQKLPKSWMSHPMFHPDVQLGLRTLQCSDIAAKDQGSVSSAHSPSLSLAELIMGSAHCLLSTIIFSEVPNFNRPHWMWWVLFTWPTCVVNGYLITRLSVRPICLSWLFVWIPIILFVRVQPIKTNMPHPVYQWTTWGQS